MSQKSKIQNRVKFFSFRSILAVVSFFLLSNFAYSAKPVNPPQDRGLLTGEHTRVTNPNALSVEVLGRGGLFSVNFDRVLTDEFSAGIGIGTLSGRSTDGSTINTVSATIIPLYVNYYFQRSAGSVFATAGMSLVRFNGSQFDAKLGNYDLEGNGIVPGFGAGYENRGDYGFLFRVTAYAFITKNITPWLGFAFGYAF